MGTAQLGKSAGHRGQSTMKQHLTERTHLTTKPTRLQERGWAGTWSERPQMETALWALIRIVFCQIQGSAEGANVGGRGSILSNQTSMPVHHSAARPSRGYGNIISRAHYLCKGEPREVLALFFHVDYR